MARACREVTRLTTNICCLVGNISGFGFLELIVVTRSSGLETWMDAIAKAALPQSEGRTLRLVGLRLYHALGALPEPEFAHRFC